MSPFFLGCKCCKTCDGEYDVLCYSATTGYEKRRQYHGHGAPGIDLGERRDAQHRPNRIAVTTTSVIVAGAVSLTIAPLDKCGEAITVNRGTGDYWYHSTAPSGYAGDPLGPTWYNSPNSPNNYNGKWNFSGEDYRHGYFVSKYPINGGDTAWIGWGWLLRNQSASGGLVLEVASLRLTSDTTYEWIPCVSNPASVTTPYANKGLSYGGENASYVIGYTENTPYATVEDLNDATDAIYPGFSAITFGTSSGVDLPDPPTVTGGSQWQGAWKIAGAGGDDNASLDQVVWKGYSRIWTTVNSFAAFGLRNQLGTVAATTGSNIASVAGALPGSGPAVYYFDHNIYWNVTTDINARSMSPGRGVTSGVLWVHLSVGWDDFPVHCTMLFKGVYVAYAWSPVYNEDETISEDSENVRGMDGPADYANGKIYCFRGTSESTATEDTFFTRSFTRADLGSPTRSFGEHAKIATAGNIYLMVCDPGDLRNKNRINSLIPVVEMPRIEVEYETPFGTCDGYPKVPQAIFVEGEYLYALVCDDDNKWDFRWLQKYHIGETSLELIWQVQPEFEWQAFHSFCVRGPEVWVTVTASDEQTFSNPTTWIGYNIDDPEPWP